MSSESKPSDQKRSWNIPITLQSKWRDIGVTSLKFTFEQSEKYLNESIRAGDLIKDKAYRILGIAVAVVTGCLIYLTSSSTHEENTILFITACISLVQSFVAITLLIVGIKRYRIHVAGSEPKTVLIENFVFDKFSTDEEQFKNLLLNECQEYQKRIDHNVLSNQNRSRFVELGMFLLIFLPIDFGVALGFNFFLTPNL